MSRYPVWASLARDYLSIMATSVSSERAFSQGGITIGKRRNRLKGDIVEALQSLKCAIRRDLLFKAPAPSAALEEELNSGMDVDVEVEHQDASVAAAGSSGEGGHPNEESWDLILDSDDEDISFEEQFILRL